MNNSDIKAYEANASTEVRFEKHVGEPTIILNALPENINADSAPNDFGWISIKNSSIKKDPVLEEYCKVYQTKRIYVGEPIDIEEFLASRESYDGDSEDHTALVERAIKEGISFVAVSTDIIPTKSGKPGLYAVNIDDHICPTREAALEATKNAIGKAIDTYHK